MIRRSTLYFAALFTITASFFITLRTDAQQTPLAGRNVNMVSGTDFPGGDPFLQRQNEPSIAVSTRNPQHILAGANDYRTVDIKFDEDPDDEKKADAWIGIFKSFDGGNSWTSTLLPGYPQDSSTPVSPIHGYQAAADVTVRAGTNGLFYVTGIVFDRSDGGKSAVFVSRYIDNNNQEGSDTISYVDTRIIASQAAGSGLFMDKPWLAVDIPRSAVPTLCTIPQTQVGSTTVPSQSIRAGNIYVGYTLVDANNPDDGPDNIVVARSTNCGAIWQGTGPAAVPINRAQTINQGLSLAIDPTLGTLYAAWRQLSPTNTIYAASSSGNGVFSAPVKVADIAPFDQPILPSGDAPDVQYRAFRSNAYPSIAVDASGAPSKGGRVYIAVANRVGPATLPNGFGESRIVVYTSTDGLKTFNGTIADAVDASGHAVSGHQIMPAMTFAGGKLVLIYYDFRNDALKTSPGGDFVVDPILDPAQYPNLWHNVDLRVAEAAPADAPVFHSAQVSRYRFQLAPTNLPQQSMYAQQVEFNYPNLPLFAAGTAPFIGDYIDIAPSPAFVVKNGQWVYNTDPSSPTFHATWADNRDVVPPTVVGDASTNYGWKLYGPPTSAFNPATSHFSIFDGSQLQACVPTAINPGMRNQNIYSSRITQGLSVYSASNSKPLGTIQRGFVVVVKNTADSLTDPPFKTFRLTIANQPAGGQASFLQFEPLLSVDVQVPQDSSAARTVFVTSTSKTASVTAQVAEITGIGGTPVANGLTSSVILNTDVSNPNILNPNILNPNILNPDILNEEVVNPSLGNFVVVSNLQNPNILNPNILNPNILNPNILNPNILNPDILNPNILNPNILNPNILNPNILNPNILNPNILNAAAGDPDNARVDDIVWTVSNNGNTTAAYDFTPFLSKQIQAGFAFQLLVYKISATPAIGTMDPCQLSQTPHQELVVNIPNPNILNPNILNPNILNPNILNTTFALAPGETARVALRVIDLDKTDNNGITVNGQPLDIGPGESDTVRTDSIQIAGADLNAAVVAEEVNTADAASGITTPPAAASRLTIVTQELPLGRVGQTYSAKLLFSGGTSPFSQSVIAGSGPNPNSIGTSGVNLTSDGFIGNASVAGTFAFTVQVTDGAGHMDRCDLVITILPATEGALLAVVSQPDPCMDPANPQPACVTMNQVITPPTSVKAFNSAGNPLPGVPVTIGIGSGSPGAILTGTLTRTTNANGVAVFENLILNKPGTYTLLATASGYTAASTAMFNILAAPIVIGNTNDAGAGSLRQAILDSNAVPTGGGIPRLTFNIPGPAPYVIKPLSPLPVMTRPVSINATTQPGYAGQPIVQIDGSLAGSGVDGLTLTGGSSTVRGLAIGGFDGNGIVLQSGGGNRVAGNYVGTNLAGTAPFGASPWGVGLHAILIQDSANNTIGGTNGTTPGGPCTGDCNVLVASGISSLDPGKVGVNIKGNGTTSSGNQVLGNFIGVDVTGSTGMGGFYSYGVSVLDANGTVIGDGTAAGRNVVSGNNSNIIVTSNGGGTINGNYVGTNASGTAAAVNAFGGVNGVNFGIALNGGANWLVEGNVVSGNSPGTGIGVESSQSTIRGNIIGLNAAGSAPVPNVWGMWLVNLAANNIVGGTTAADRNLISGNTGYGIAFTGLDAAHSGNRIIGNYVGTDSSGTAAIPNGTGPFPGGFSWADGIFVQDAPNNSIGGTNAGEGNLIAGNAGNGVTVAGSSTGVSILSNSIYGNGGIGIDLGGDGVTTNHAPPNLDPGPNHFQNYPGGISVTPTSASAELFSTPNQTFTIQFFSSDTANHEGKTLAATVTVNTDGAGHAFIGPTPGVFPIGKWVTATATDAGGNTSEFSTAIVVP